MEGAKKTYAVWVGNLTDEITEAMLFEEFKCYGPICNVKFGKSKGKKRIAFINFYSKEVAEVAAYDMNDTLIYGIQIKTSFKDENHKAKDIRPFTDCVNFMAKKSCAKSCCFRHNKTARSSAIVCKNWLKHECLDASCENRHPGSKETQPKDVVEKNTLSFICDQCGKVFFSLEDKAGHICLTSPHDVIEKFYKPVKVLESVGIYWDLENCILPPSIKPRGFVEKIRRKFLNGKKLVEFTCVCDTSRASKILVDGLNKTEVTVVHVSATAKNAADDKLKQKMISFGDHCQGPASLILISGDVNFAPVLNKLRYTNNMTIILIHNVQASMDLKTFANECYCFDEFIADIPTGDVPSVDGPIVRTTELLAKNLPFEADDKMLMTRLSVLSNNCGGNVGKINRDHATKTAQCIIKFSSADDAERAYGRMQSQDVCGRPIVVEPYWGARQPPKALKANRMAANHQVTNTPAAKPGQFVRRCGPQTNLRKTVSMGILPTPESSQNPILGLMDLKIPSSFAVNPSFEKQTQSRAFPSTGNAKRLSQPFAISNGRPQEATFKAKVQVLLEKFPHWLSFEKFVANFQKVHKEKFDFHEFLKCKNFVYVDGKPGKKFVCLLGSRISNVSIDVQKDVFYVNLIKVLDQHNRKVPFESLPGLFWSYGYKVLRQSPAGTLLSELVSSCPGVNCQNGVFLQKPAYDVRQNTVRFVDEAVQVLHSMPNSEVPVNMFAFRYTGYFGTGIYGTDDFEQLIMTIQSRSLEVKEKAGARYIAITWSKAKEILGKELRELLSKGKRQWMPISDLPSEFYSFHGRRLLHTNQESQLIRRIKSLPIKDFRIFTGNEKRKCLTLRKVSDQRSCKPFKEFKQGLITLLSNTDGNKILIENLVGQYESFHGSCPKLDNLGFDHPDDLFKALEPEVQKIDNYIILNQADPVSHVEQILWGDVLRAILDATTKAVSLRSLPEKFQNAKESLLSSVPDDVKVLGCGQGVCFILASKYEELVSDDKETFLSTILYGASGFSVPIEEVMKEVTAIPSPISSLQLMRSSECVKLVDNAFVLDQHIAVRYFGFEVLSLLYAEPNNSCTLAAFCGKYHKKFGRQYKIKDFGFSKAVEIFLALPHGWIEILPSEGNSPLIKLARLGKFIEETKQILKENNGSVLQNQLLDIHRRKFETFRVTEHGYSSLTNFLKSFPELFHILVFNQTFPVIMLKKFALSSESGVKRNVNQAVAITTLDTDESKKDTTKGKKGKKSITSSSDDYKANSNDSSTLTDQKVSDQRSCKPFKEFKQGLITLLSNTDGNKILIENLVGEYESFHGSCPKLDNLGFDHPDDLFKALEPEVQKIDNYIILNQADPVSHVEQMLWGDVLRAILDATTKAVSLRSLPEKFQNAKESLLSSVPDDVKVLGCGQGVCFILASKYEELVSDDKETFLSTILYGASGFSVPIEEVMKEVTAIPSPISSLQLMRSSECVKLVDNAFVLDQHIAVRYFGFEVLSLLYAEPNNSCTLAAFCGKYHKKFGRQYKIKDFGFSKAVEIFLALPHGWIEILPSEGNSPLIKLARLGKFIEETKQILKENNGSVLQNQLLDIHRRKFETFRVTEHGYSSLTNFLKSFPELFHILVFNQTFPVIMLKKFALSSESGVKRNVNQAVAITTLDTDESKKDTTKGKKGKKSITSSSDDYKANSNDSSTLTDQKGAKKKKRGEKKVNAEKTVKEGPVNNSLNRDGSPESSNSSFKDEEDKEDSSDDASVVIESEEVCQELPELLEFNESFMSSQSESENDLLYFSGTESESDLDWWMNEVPDYLPEPSIEPQPIRAVNENTDFDLILFDDYYDESGDNSQADEDIWASLKAKEPEILPELANLKLH